MAGFLVAECKECGITRATVCLAETNNAAISQLVSEAAEADLEVEFRMDAPPDVALSCNCE